MKWCVLVRFWVVSKNWITLRSIFFLWITSGLLENYTQGYSLTRTPKTGVEWAWKDCLRMVVTGNSFQWTMQGS
jgi:hypothetical protein